MVEEILEKDFEEFVKGNKVVIIDCYADWCPPCKMLAPVFEELANELGNKAKFAKLNVDNARRIAEMFEISAIPTILIFKDGELVDRITGLYPKPLLKLQIEKFL